ncbi:MAG: Gfo/Idh/MocA family oxidoreductase [Salinivirgaceae bacterium]|jgi:predicted dehydrogenase|nr:Gfo/Idh/MocA family oxidoreductase [Salinivirgaceae bacterium]
MERRKFLGSVSLGAVGIGMLGSCKGGMKGDGNTTNNQVNSLPPSYRTKIKSSFSSSNSQGANDRVVLALIGAGGWGTGLAINVMDINKNVAIKYVCDVDDTRGGMAIAEIEKRQGNAPIRVRDMRNIFDDKEVDGVIISTPQHWHGLASIWAMQAGKDVYVEKCVSFTIGEGQKMVEAAMKYERILQCGTQNRSAAYNFSARDYIKRGELGDIVAVDVMELDDGPIPFKEKEESSVPDTIDWDLWLGPAPKVPYSISRNKSWLNYWDYSGGAELSNGAIHQIDLARFVLGDPGFPKSVYCTGGRYLFDDKRDVPDYQMTTFDYDKFVMTLKTGAFTPYMSKASSEIRNSDLFPEWKLNCEKIIIYGTKRVMFLGRMGAGWQVFEKDGKIAAQEYGRFPLKSHIENFVDCIRTRNQPNAGIVEGHKSSVLVHLANLSYRAGKKQLMFSPEYEIITNDATAQTMAEGSYRKGFELPTTI